MTQTEWNELMPGDLVKHQTRGQYIVANRVGNITFGFQTAAFVSDDNEWTLHRKANYIPVEPEPKAKPTLVDRLADEVNRGSVSIPELKGRIEKIFLEEGFEPPF